MTRIVHNPFRLFALAATAAVGLDRLSTVGLPVGQAAGAALSGRLLRFGRVRARGAIVVVAAGLALRVGIIERPAARVPALTAVGGLVVAGAGVATLAVLARSSA